MEYNFDNFRVSDENRAAYEAALAIVKEKKGGLTVIYGNSGCGKTHLLYAIKNEIEKRSDKSCRYFRIWDLKQNMIEQIRAGKDCYCMYREYTEDVFLIDNLEMISRMDATSELFISIFNLLYEEGKQIVIAYTGDVNNPPTKMSSYLTSRLTWGKQVEIFRGNDTTDC